MPQDARPAGFYVWARDFVADDDFAAMDLAERGLYWTLLCYAWINDGIPDDPRRIANLVGAGATPEFVESCELVLGKFKRHGKGKLTHPRLEAELRRQRAFSEKQRRAAESGARKRAERRSQKDEDYQDVASRGSAVAGTRLDSGTSQTPAKTSLSLPIPEPQGNSNGDVVAASPPPTWILEWSPGELELEIAAAEGIDSSRIPAIVAKFRAYLAGGTVKPERAGVSWGNFVAREAKFEAIKREGRPGETEPHWQTRGYESFEQWQAHSDARARYAADLRLGLPATEPEDPRPRKRKEPARRKTA